MWPSEHNEHPLNLRSGYLCDLHLQQVKENPGDGCCRWARMMRLGNQAYQQNNFALADRHFGGASDIARTLIRQAHPYAGQMFAAERLLIATQNWSITLARQERHSQAGCLLVALHRELLQLCEDDRLARQVRAAARSCLQPSLQRIREFLRTAKDQQAAEELQNLTCEVQEDLRNQVCH